MKNFFLAFTIVFLAVTSSFAQRGRVVFGTVTDSTKLPLPSSTVLLTSDLKDSIITTTDNKGKFTFAAVKGTKINLVLSLNGFQSIRKHYTLAADTTPADLGASILKQKMRLPNLLTQEAKADSTKRTVAAQTPAVTSSVTVDPAKTRATSIIAGSREVHGIIIDSTKATLPSSTIVLTSDQRDSTTTIADINGKFVFPAVKGTKIVITVSSIGYRTLKRRYTLPADNTAADLGPIVLKTESTMLKGVTIVGIVPVTLKEDTVQYQAKAYQVRENAPVEDLIKKLPGVDVDVNGNISTQGKQITKIRINGKDFMGGDVQSATKNLPADVVENIQMIDDYGDQANLTGVKTGEPNKIMNITIRQDKNYGYFGQATVGDGEDALPQSQGIADQNRYIGSINAFKFKGNQQIAVLGSINNTNVNTFSFGSTPGGGGGNFGGGGGRGNAGRGGGNSGSLTTGSNGITEAHSLGANFRDQWGKYLSVYGSYSFADNTTTTTTNTLQQNTSQVNPSTENQNSIEKDESINHRFTWNMEYKPDTINYLKVTPTFSYSGSNTNINDNVNFQKNNVLSSAYTSLSTGDSQSPNYGFSALYNHRFKNRSNFSIYTTLSTGTGSSYQNPIYNFTAGVPSAPQNQIINTSTRSTTYGTTLSYLQHISKLSYLEYNYSFNRSITNNNKETDTLYNVPAFIFRNDAPLSTNYNYTFTTNRFGLNYRFIEKKYNYTLGIGAEPAVLAGNSITTGVVTNKSSFNIIPAARFVYDFSRGKSFSLNYNGSSSQPTFAQLQPVTDLSNALYPVQGNPNLQPQFTNSVQVRYNNFSFTTGDIFFVSLQYSQINNQVVTNTTTSAKTNSILTQYLNANGYSLTQGRFTYAKPWDNRKFTLTFNGTLSYTNNIGYLTSIDSNKVSTTQKNTAKNLNLTPEIRFRIDITNRVDVQLLTNYAINKTDNSVQSPINSGSSNVRTWNVGVNGKNYFGDWTFSYDFTKATNYGYSSSLQVTNPNILNVYLERRFLKDHRGTFRIAAYDLFNQNTGFSSSTSASSITQSHVNKLARYYLATFTLRLQKFAGKAPADPGRGGFDGPGRGPGGGGRGPGGFGGGPGGE